MRAWKLALNHSSKRLKSLLNPLALSPRNGSMVHIFTYIVLQDGVINNNSHWALRTFPVLGTALWTFYRLTHDPHMAPVKEVSLSFHRWGNWGSVSCAKPPAWEWCARDRNPRVLSPHPELSLGSRATSLHNSVPLRGPVLLCLDGEWGIWREEG